MSDLQADSSLPSIPTRRSFLKGAGAAMLAPGRAWGLTGRVAASNRITLGVIGWGMMGPSNTKAFLQQSDCQVVAACDLHKDHLQSAVDTIDNRYGNKDCQAY
jgi:ornithine cyclodeaminase/alanine dehydrogenase-like protein (mu-crystallin family)